jgi:hypothetical protein
LIKRRRSISGKVFQESLNRSSGDLAAYKHSIKYGKNLMRACFVLASLTVLAVACQSEKPSVQTASGSEISLAGTWSFAADPENLGISESWFSRSLGSDTIELPGTTDDKKFGTPHGLQPDLEKKVLRTLARRHTYVGPAWYQKTVVIPQQWQGKTISLQLERVIWETQVWVNGQHAGMSDSLIAPHTYDLTGFLKPGPNQLTLRIDNAKKYNIGAMAHAHSLETQIMWNGVVGDVSLQAADPVHVTDLQVYPDVAAGKARTVVTIANTGRPKNMTLTLTAAAVGGKQHKVTQTKELELPEGQTSVEVDVAMGPDVQLWDEYSPVLYEMRASLGGQSAKDAQTIRFGMRQVTTDGMRLLVNGRPVFLRGTLECCIFPNSGHPPMDKAEWRRILSIAQSYGLNHLRFHSWCPPKAAFEAADELGVYLQPELPVWVNDMGKDPARDAFLEAEADRLIRNYGNHPSFLLMSIGNELEGDYAYIHSLVKRLQKEDPRHLYTSTAFSFQGQHGRWPEPVDDFFITQQTTKGWIRGQGFFNVRPPSTAFDFRQSLDGMPVPVISHEIGQYAVFPNLKEIEKYTGVNDPMNFKAIQADLQRKGLLPLAESYLMASGKLSALLYKEDIEMCMRTPGMSGFQLLDLHDFPGQGTALVGILDAFWDSKGLITPEQFRRFCNRTVPLARLDKRTFENTESFEASVEVIHYGPQDLKDAAVNWTVCDAAGAVLKRGQWKRTLPVGTSTSLGKVSFPLARVDKASKLVLKVELAGTEYQNDWEFWVYPAQQPVQENNIIIADYFDDKTQAALAAGKTVLLLPGAADLRDKETGKFTPVFWSPVHFPNQPITTGLLCDPSHPAFRHFPTEFHTNWQWWELLTQSVSVVMDAAPRDFEPVVRMVDGFTKNRRLYSLFEAKVGGGKLLFCSMDISSDLEKRIAARQLRRSLLAYISSDEFAPTQELSPAFVKGLFTESTSMRGARIKANSQQPGYEASLAIDGDPKTVWHSAWQPETPKYPHVLEIELREPMVVKGFRYLTRQDGNRNGRIAAYEFFVSTDGLKWDKPLASGTFADDDSLKTVLFDDAEAIYSDKQKVRHVRFKAVNGFNNDPFACIAELELIVE